MHRLPWIIWLVFFISAVFFSFLTNVYGFVYGAVVSLVNVSLYYGFYWRHRRRVPAYSGQALTVVISSTVTRFFFVGLLLVLGWEKLNLEPKSLILGFVLGQIFYLVNQLITVRIHHGK